MGIATLSFSPKSGHHYNLIDDERIVRENKKSKILITPWGAFRAPKRSLANSRLQSYFHPSTTKNEASVAPAAAVTPIFRPDISNRYLHQTLLYTRGLTFDKWPWIIESEGYFSGSSIRKFDYKTGTVKVSRVLPYVGSSYVGGLCILGRTLYLGQSQSNTVYLFDKDSLEPINIGEDDTNVLHLPPGGPMITRGLAVDQNSKTIYLSDGTETLYILDQQLNLQGSLTVHDNDIPMYGLVDLEFVEGIIYANIEGRFVMCKILPETGTVVGWLLVDEASIRKSTLVDDGGISASGDDVRMNGIAYDRAHKVIVFTGKRWPYIYEISSSDFGEPIKSALKGNQRVAFLKRFLWSPQNSYKNILDGYNPDQNTALMTKPSKAALRLFRENTKKSREKSRAMSERYKNLLPPPLTTLSGDTMRI